MNYYHVNYKGKKLCNHYGNMANQCLEHSNGGARIGSCNIATANAMSCPNAFRDAGFSSGSSSIPRDFLTFTNQPSANPYYPKCYKNINENTCASCNVSYECMDDADKQLCFECAKARYNCKHYGKPYDPSNQCFLYKFVKPE